MIQLIGWTILHSLWQITLIAGLYWMGKFSFRKASANTQYLAGISALIASFLAPVFTFYYLWTPQATTLLSTTLLPITNDNINSTVPLNIEEVGTLAPTSFLDYLPIVLPYLVAFWAVGVLYFTFRFLHNLSGVKKLKNIESELIGREWRNRINTFSAQLGINKQVQVYLSTYVKEPLTFGHFKPVILLPISLITDFDTKAIETIILHELAHIKRHDYLVNLGQSIIEIILFYHPLVWWLSNEIRTVREHCCDDLVLKMGDNRTTYVETLTALQWRKAGVPMNRLSMTATGEASDFSRRIKRMFGVEEERKFSFRQLMSLFLILLIPACGGVLYKQYDFDKLFFKNETGVDYPDKKLTYVLDEHTNMEYIREIKREVKDLGITIGDLSFCTNMVYDSLNNQKNIKSVSGLILRNKGKAIPFYGSDLEKEPLKLIFDNGFLKEPILLKNNQKKSRRNELSQKEEVIILDSSFVSLSANEKNEILMKHGIFQLAVFGAGDDKNAMWGEYKSIDGRLIPFKVFDLEKRPLRITIQDKKVKEFVELIRNTKTPKPSDSYLNGLSSSGLPYEVRNKDLKATLVINKWTTREDLETFAKKIKENNIQFIYDNSTFNQDGTIKKMAGDFLDRFKNSEPFLVDDFSKYQIKLRVKGGYIYQPEITQVNYNKSPNIKLSETNSNLNIDESNSEEIKSRFTAGNLLYGNDFLNNHQADAIKVNAPLFKRFPSADKKENWIYWGDKKIPFSAKFEADKNGIKKLQVPKLQFTKKEWNYLHQQPITFYLAEEWFKIQGMFAIVLVPKKKDPVLVMVHKDYYQIVKDESERATRLMARANVGDMLYFEKIDVGKDFNFGMVIEIIEDESTGYLLEKDENLNENIEIDFKKAESEFSKGRIPAYQGKVAPQTFTPSLLNEVQVPSFQKDFVFPRGQKINNKPTFVNGVKYDESWMSPISTENIESINVVKGVKAKTLYGVEEAILITTKKGTGNFLSKPVIKKEETPNKN